MFAFFAVFIQWHNKLCDRRVPFPKLSRKQKDHTEFCLLFQVIILTNSVYNNSEGRHPLLSLLLSTTDRRIPFFSLTERYHEVFSQTRYERNKSFKQDVKLEINVKPCPNILQQNLSLSSWVFVGKIKTKSSGLLGKHLWQQSSNYIITNNYRVKKL